MLKRHLAIELMILSAIGNWWLPATSAEPEPKKEHQERRPQPPKPPAQHRDNQRPQVERQAQQQRHSEEKRENAQLEQQRREEGKRANTQFEQERRGQPRQKLQPGFQEEGGSLPKSELKNNFPANAPQGLRQENNRLPNQNFGRAASPMQLQKMYGPRPSTPPPLPSSTVPLSQASPGPVLQGHWNAKQQGEFQQANQNLQNNLAAVPLTSAPQNYQALATQQSQSFLNGYPFTHGGQTINITPQNTYASWLSPASYPHWYQPAPGWNFASGLVLGAMSSRGLNWLFGPGGWPHYYGPRPAGFIAANSYFPTPWIYYPWANQWGQMGTPGFGLGGPPPQYVMPITVEAIEPITVNNISPITGLPVPQIINQPVMYNAYYYPRFGRWGYTNRNGYFVWVNPQTAMIPAAPF